MNAKTERIRALNDELRTTLRGGKIHATTGIAALGTETQAAIIGAVQAFDAFTPDNDPYKEHDFGLIEIADERVMFKIDYYDRSMRLHSPDPSGPKVTVRVMTIMLDDEY